MKFSLAVFVCGSGFRALFKGRLIGVVCEEDSVGVEKKKNFVCCNYLSSGRLIVNFGDRCIVILGVWSSGIN